MGKNIVQQARGKGGPRYRSPGFRFRGATRHIGFSNEQRKGVIADIIHCPGHTAPLCLVKYDDGESLTVAAEGIRVGETVTAGTQSEISTGNTISLREIPEGTYVYNIEAQRGDGGKFCRASGACARVLGTVGQKVLVELPSKKQRAFHPDCRATIGQAAGGGRPEKPFLKAGARFYIMRARNKLYPTTSGKSMNAVDHPFGNKRSARKAKQRVAPKNAPPGRKVGKVRAKRTGRKKR